MKSTRFLLLACAFGSLLSPTVFAAGEGVRLRLRSGNRPRLPLSLGVGAEINARTHGEKVGDGAIGLAGVTLSRW